MNIQFKAILIISLFLLCTSCDKDSDSNFEKVNTVTGIAFTDENGSALGQWQFPNEKDTDVGVFPNPAIDVISLFSLVPLSGVWIILGDCEGEDIGADITEMSQSLSYTVSDIVTNQIVLFSDTQTSSNQRSIDISDLEEGFYRIFFEIEATGEIFWKNFYKANEPTGGVNLGELLDVACE